MNQFRQGDLLIQEVSALPDDVRKLPRNQGRLILALGEVTGHHHAVAERHAELLEDKAHEIYLQVMSAPALLVHQEHATVEIPPGTYRVIRQREYAPGAVRRVAD